MGENLLCRRTACPECPFTTDPNAVMEWTLGYDRREEIARSILEEWVELDRD